MQVNKIRYLSNYSQLEIDALKHIGYQVTPFHRIITNTAIRVALLNRLIYGMKK